MDFDQLIDRRGTKSSKWDNVVNLYDVTAEGCLPMWVADTDFRAPDFVQDALKALWDHGVYAYQADYSDYTGAITWWMAHRHGWEIEPSWIHTTTGVVNGIAMCIETFSQPGDGVVTFTPVYHAFARVIKSAGRRVVECPLAIEDGLHKIDFEDAQSRLSGDESILFLCSPHNPGGRVWTRDELEGVAEFARRNDLILVSDEIHHDLVFEGHNHIPMAHIDGILDRLVMLTAVSKTFNLAGHHTGNAIIPDPALNAKFTARMKALSIEKNLMGVAAATAAYSPAGAEWVDAFVAYLDGNRKIFDAGLNAIPGVRSMPLQSTFLSWVDFSGTGMSPAEIHARVEKTANIAANHGHTFGTGGETWLRFNFGTQRARIEEAVARMQDAFSDLQ